MHYKCSIFSPLLSLYSTVSRLDMLYIFFTNSYLREWKRNMAKMAEEHWWAITQACSHAWVHHVSVCWSMDFNWSPLYTDTLVGRTYTKFRLVPELPERNYCVICEVSVLHSPSGEVNSTRLNGNITQRTTTYMTSASDALRQISTCLSVALMVSHKWLQQLAQFYVDNGSHKPHGVTPPSGPGPPPCWSFKLTLRHTLRPVGLLQTSK